jgi:hypothetical protein
MPEWKNRPGHAKLLEVLDYILIAIEELGQGMCPEYYVDHAKERISQLTEGDLD